MMRCLIGILFLLGIGCARAGLKTVLPPLDPRCAKEKIDAADIGYLHNFIAPAITAEMQAKYMKTAYYVGTTGDNTYTPPLTNRPWFSPDSALCLRLAVARSPHCPGNESSLDCRNDYSWWALYGPLLGGAIRRIQTDQNSCRLNDLYDEFLQYPHTENEKAAVCLGMLLYDPGMVNCLEVNKAALQHLARTGQRRDRQTYSTMLYNGFFSNAPLWDKSYDPAVAWIMTNLFPLMNRHEDNYFSSYIYYTLVAVKAFRENDRDGLFNILIEMTHSASPGDLALDMLFKLGLKGDEEKRLLEKGASEWLKQAFKTQLIIHEKALREGHDPFMNLNAKPCLLQQEKRVKN